MKSAPSASSPNSMNSTKSSSNLKKPPSAVHRNKPSPVCGWNTPTNPKRNPRESRTFRIDSISSVDSREHNPASAAMGSAGQISFLAPEPSETGAHTVAVLAVLAEPEVSAADTAAGSAAMAAATVTAASAAARAAATSAATAQA